MASALAMQTDVTLSWEAVALEISWPCRYVRIHPIPAVIRSDRQAASVLQNTVRSFVEEVRARGFICGVWEVWEGLDDWACSHSFWTKIALVAVSMGVRYLFSKMARFLDVQITHQNHGNAFPEMTKGGRFLHLIASWIILMKIEVSFVSTMFCHGPSFHTSFAKLQVLHTLSNLCWRELLLFVGLSPSRVC